MRRAGLLKFLLASIFFATVNSIVVAVVAKLAVDFWGRPRGVAYGILGYYLWVYLSIIGLAAVTIFRVLPVNYALLVNISIIAIPTLLVLPSTGERPVLSVSTAAVVMCMLLGLWTKITEKRRAP